jgi:serine/threonine protein kinase
MTDVSLYCPNCGAVNQPQAATCFACGQALAADAAPAGVLTLDHLLRGRYRLVAPVGKGGFGAVYRAEDTQLGNRLVAVKEMSQRGLTPEELSEATEAFHQEALLLANLTHPNLPRIYEQFEESGHWYLVMDFIAGQTLEEYLAARPGGRLPLEEALQYGLQLATVLGYLHTRQPPIIFRDLKPSNVMLTPDGQVYLIDFGIARLFKPGQTRDTVAFGSAGYAAPEQYGKAQTTTQSDIYSLGATLHQLISGTDPSDHPFVFEPLDLKTLRGLETLVMQMLETNQNKRPTSMLAVRQELQRMANLLALQPKALYQPPAPAPAMTLVNQPSAPPAPQPIIPAPRPVSAPPRPVIPARGDLIRRYSGHRDIVKSVAWSLDGKLIVSAGCDGTIQVWEALTGSPVNISRGHRSQINAVCWSPDGKRFASASADRTVRVWSATSGRALLSYEGHKGLAVQILSLAWSPDGNLIASGASDGNAHIWDAATGERQVMFYCAGNLVNALAWSPDGTRLLSGSHARLQLRQADGQLIHTYEGQAHINALAWSPDGRYSASGSDEGMVCLWEMTAQYVLRAYQGHYSPVQAVAWSPDGKLIASAGKDRTVQVWDAFTEEANAFYYRGHTGAVETVAWSPDGKLIASAGYDGTVQVWRAVASSA